MGRTKRTLPSSPAPDSVLGPAVAGRDDSTTVAFESFHEVTLPRALFVTVHDATRFEWRIRVPIDILETLSFSSVTEFELPSDRLPVSAGWDHMQSFARIDRAAHVLASAAHAEADSDRGLRSDEPRSTAADSLRAEALPVQSLADGSTQRRGASRLAEETPMLDELVWASERLDRVASGADRHLSHLSTQISEEEARVHEASLLAWVRVAEQALDRYHAASDTARQTLSSPQDAWKLADEYISAVTLKVLGSVASRAIALSRGTTCDLGRVLARVETLLRAESEWRRAHNLPLLDGKGRNTEAFMARYSQLKKHFQRRSYVEVIHWDVAQRLHNWASAAVALVASFWALAWQLFFLDQLSTTAGRVGSTLALLAVLGGLVYVIKDRIKDLGRVWIARAVSRYFAQRITEWRMGSKTGDQAHLKLGRAKETLERVRGTRKDPLNPESGDEFPFVSVRFTQSGKFEKEAVRALSGTTLQLIFRFDISAMLPWLNDAKLPLAVVTEKGLEVINARRSYRIPFTSELKSNHQHATLRATLVVNKQGLKRVENAELRR